MNKLIPLAILCLLVIIFIIVILILSGIIVPIVVVNHNNKSSDDKSTKTTTYFTNIEDDVDISYQSIIGSLKLHHRGQLAEFDETSGICYNKETSTYFVAQNRTQLIEYNTNFEFVNYYYLPNDKDTEGVTYIDGGDIAVIDEKGKYLRKYNVKDGKMVSIDKIKVELDNMEGLAYDKKRDNFYVATKSSNSSIYYIKNNYERTTHLFSTKDSLSGLYYDYISDTIMGCSDKTKYMSQYDLKGNVLSRVDISDSNMDKIEGLTINGNRKKIIIVGEQNDYAIYNIEWLSNN